jgi:hypothetical protein
MSLYLHFARIADKVLSLSQGQDFVDQGVDAHSCSVLPLIFTHAACLPTVRRCKTHD